MMNQVWVHERHERVDIKETTSLSAVPTRRSPLDPATLRQLRSLQRPGQPDLLQRLADRYVNHASQSMCALREAVKQSDTKAMHQLAHTLKSSSASLGAIDLAEMYGKLELMGRTGAAEGAEELLCRIDSEFQAVRDALAAETASDRA